METEQLYIKVNEEAVEITPKIDINIENGEGNNSIIQKVADEVIPNEASGVNSSAIGTSTEASGDSSHSEGLHTTIGIEAGHVEGKYNVQVSNGIHIVGIGTEDQHKNAHVITVDGKHYIPGIGNYNGIETTFDGIKDLATIINELGTLIKEPLIIYGSISESSAIGGVFESNEIYTASDIKTAFLNGRQIIIGIEQSSHPNLPNLQYAKLCSISKTIYNDTNYYVFGFYGTDINEGSAAGEYINWLVETNE